MVESAISKAGDQFPEELVLADLRTASDFLQEVTGKRTTEDLLDAIFSTFCVGK
jgi:tRNA modification GTPase